MNRIDPKPEPAETDGTGTSELDSSSAAPQDLTETQTLPTSDPASERVSEPVSQPVSEAVSQPVSEPGADPADEVTGEPSTGPVAGLLPDLDALAPTTPTAEVSPELGPHPSTNARISLDKGAGHGAADDRAASVGSPTSATSPATPGPAYPPRRPVSTRLRVGTAVWGLMLAAAGVWIVAWAGGARIDAGLALIVLLAGGGAALLVGSIVAGARRQRRAPHASRESVGPA